MSRYVIKDPLQGYFTEVKIVKTTPVYLNKRLMGHENEYRPVFEGMNKYHASQFATEADARGLMDDPEYGGASAFANCIIEPSGV